MAVPATSDTRNNVLLLVALLFAQLLLMAASVRDMSGSSTLRGWISGATSPLVSAAGGVGGGAESAIGGLRGLLDARARSRELEQRVARLEEELARSREAALENVRLRRLLLMREHLAPASIGASVVTSSLTDETKMIVIDRGARQGVKLHLPVVAWGGAVGHVVEVGSDHALVRLIHDPRGGVAGVVQRSRAQGLVFGEGGTGLDMRYVPRFSDVAVGDRVVTSGLDGIFPRGFGIGTVVGVHDSPDGSQRIELAPELDFRSLEEVLVLLEPVGGELLDPGPDEPAP